MELYNNPANLFVAGFIGSPPMNFLHGTILRDSGGRLTFVEKNSAGQPIKIALNEKLTAKAAQRLDQPVILGLRPENVHDAVNGDRMTELRIEVAEPMGAETLLYLTSGAHSLIARVQPNHRLELGQNLAVSFDLDHAHLFDPATEQVL
jgi:multiple sugar transport system ATP-binding protein